MGINNGHMRNNDCELFSSNRKGGHWAATGYAQRDMKGVGSGSVGGKLLQTHKSELIHKVIYTQRG